MKRVAREVGLDVDLTRDELASRTSCRGRDYRVEIDFREVGVASGHKLPRLGDDSCGPPIVIGDVSED